MIDFQNIPAELRQYKNWVVWKLERRKGKATKPPYTISGRKASTTDPDTWSTFDEAVNAYDNGNFDGIGFVFTR